MGEALKPPPYSTPNGPRTRTTDLEAGFGVLDRDISQMILRHQCANPFSQLDQQSERLDRGHLAFYQSRGLEVLVAKNGGL